METLVFIGKVVVMVLAIAAFSCVLAFPLLYLLSRLLVFLPPLSLLIVGLIAGACLIGLGHPAIGLIVMVAALFATLVVFKLWGKKL